VCNESQHEREAWLTAEIANTKTLLSLTAESDFLGQVGFKHRLRKLEKELNEIRSPLERSSLQPRYPED
jgi:hypothetical protein